MSRSRRNHVFVLRHCTRATYPDVELYVPHGQMYTDDVPPADQSNYRDPKIEKLDAQEFIASPMPDFGVPTRWCLPASLENIKGNGADIMRKILASRTGTGDAQGINEKRVIKFEIVTDTYIRNVDSAYFFTVGIREEVRNHNGRVVVSGLEDIKADHFSFHPIDKEYFVNTICNFTYTGERFNNDLLRRLATVPSPPLNYTFKLMERLGGVGPAGPLSQVEPAGQILLNPYDHELEGVANLLKLFGQMMFYSRSGGVDPPFLPNATIEEVYFMCSWINYVRSILNLENVHSATTGAMLANKVLRRLRDVNKDEDMDYDDKVTIYMAHDGNIDDMATVFGLRWVLPPPYHQDIPEFLPTPAGSGVQFTHHIDEGIAEVAYLYTTFLNPPRNDKEKYWLNNTGIMDSIPVLFLPDHVDADFSLSSGKTSVKISHMSNDSISGEDLLKLRLFSMFERYPEAVECYNAMDKHETQVLGKESKINFSGDDLYETPVLVTTAMLLGLVVLCLLCVKDYNRNKKGSASEKENLLKTNGQHDQSCA